MLPAKSAATDALYAEIVRDHAAAIRRVARAYERDGSLAEDLAQDIFLEIWRSLGTFENRSSARTWVHRVAHNVAVEHVVRAKNARYSNWVSLAEVETLAAPSTLERGMDLDAIWTMLDRLQPADKQVLLSWLEGLTGKEIAEVTGLSESAVGVKVHRAKVVLARYADDEV